MYEVLIACGVNKRATKQKVEDFWNDVEEKVEFDERVRNRAETSEKAVGITQHTPLRSKKLSIFGYLMT